MLPYFKCGDFVGGFYVDLEDIVSRLPLSLIHKTPWLLMLDKPDFAPRFLVVSDNKEAIFYRTNIEATIKNYSVSTIGQICWHHSDINDASLESKIA